jgi:hypothetical protein
MTVDGQVVQEYHGKHGGRAVKTLAAAHEVLGERLPSALGNGTFHYNLNVGSDGVCLTIPVGDEYMVWMKLAHPRSLDTMLKGVREGIAPLLDILGSEA